jgi:hypothetical protein
VFLGYGLLALAGVALVLCLARWRAWPAWRPVAALVVIGAAAVVMAVGAAGSDCGPRSWAPACRLHDLLPMFRSYARFAFVAQLSVAIAAGLAAAELARRSRASFCVAAALLAVACVEYWPLPWKAHDVLPTEAHRWLAGEPAARLTLDCVPPDPVTSATAWLMNHRVTTEGGRIGSCQAPDLTPRLAALGYTHVLVRAGREDIAAAARSDGLSLVRAFHGARLYAVTAGAPAGAVIEWLGFHPYERQGDDWWRWMGDQGGWTVRIREGAGTVVLEVGLESFAVPRRLVVTLDGAPAGTILVATRNERHRLGPWTLQPGDHALRFTALEPPSRPSAMGLSGDDRELTVAVRAPVWTAVGHGTDR